MSKYLSILLLLGLLAGCSSTQHSLQDCEVPVAAIDPLEDDPGTFLDGDENEYNSLAYKHYEAGHYQEAAQYYLLSLKKFGKNPTAIYNLSCLYGLMNEPELASKFLKRAFAAGFEDLDLVKTDPDFDNVRENKYFSATVDSIQEKFNKRAELSGKLEYISSQSLLKCRIQVPENYDPQKSYPLLVGLHGWGASPDNFIYLWKRFEKPEFIYVALQAPYPFMSGKNLGYSWVTWDKEDQTIEGRSTALTIDYVASAVEELKTRYAVDDTYLMGFSQGSGFTYAVGINHPELFKGLICYGGWLEVDKIGEDKIAGANSLRVFIGHGTQDRVVEFKAAEAANEVLVNHGYEVKMMTYPEGHTIPQEALTAAQKWMKE